MEALCKADAVKHVYLFTPDAYKTVAKLNYVTHSPRLSAWFGDGIARVIGAWRMARTIQPDLVIGYHLPWNGLMALLIARRSAAKTAYFSVGGPPELIGGGIYSEHALFSRLNRENAYIEGRLINLLREFDAILTMGTRSRDFFSSLEIDTPAIPVAAGINDTRFSSRDSTDRANAEFDLVSVGRLSAIKQTDEFIKLVAGLEQDGRPVYAAIVGDGDQLANLQALATELNVSDRVRFFGWVDDVEDILKRSKVFVMTSASEGLPHSLIEAMLTGMPAIVPNVGEIGDLVASGLNGYLIMESETQSFVSNARLLLDDSDNLEQFGIAARRSALRYTVDERVFVWNDALDRIMTSSADNQSAYDPE
jgi:glycosyltransferase involved in cell wall biosynthesis